MPHHHATPTLTDQGSDQAVDRLQADHPVRNLLGCVTSSFRISKVQAKPPDPRTRPTMSANLPKRILKVRPVVPRPNVMIMAACPRAHPRMRPDLTAMIAMNGFFFANAGNRKARVGLTARDRGSPS